MSGRPDRPGHAVPIDVIVDRLTDRLEALCLELVGGGRRGAEWVALSSRHGGVGDGLSVRLTGPKRGVWEHFGDPRRPHGDALDLVAYAKGLSKGDAVQWAKSWLGLDTADRAAIERMGRRPRRDPELERRRQEKSDRQKRAKAIERWNEAIAPDGTPVADYLAGRGLPLDALPAETRRLVRFHPALWCSEVEARRPAMLLPVFSLAGGLLTVHRTWLAKLADGDGVLTWRKAPLAAAKKAFGAYRGGVIPISRGGRGPLGKAPPNETVAVSEGFEDGASVALSRPDLRVMAAVALSNLGAIEFPANVGRLVWLAQNDPPDSRAAQQLDAALEAHRGRRLRVEVARPPQGCKDWNDLLRQPPQRAAG